MKRIALVDADAHVNEPPELWEQYLPDTLKDRGPRIATREDGSQVWVINERPAGSLFHAFNVMGASPVNWQVMAPGGYSSWRPGAWDPAERIKDMDIDMVDGHILFPSFLPGLMAESRRDPELHVEIARAYNNWLSDFCSYCPSRLFGMAQIPATGIDDAIAEAKRASDLPGMRGLNLQMWPNGSNRPDHDEDDRFWSVLEDLDMGLAIHIMFGMGGEHGSSEEDESDFFKRITSLSTINNERTAASMMPTLNHFILGGVLHRHPRLRIGFTETGIGWVPFWLEQTDDNFLRHRFWTNCDLPMLPSEYWARSCYATFQIDYYGLRNRDLLGVETIMWSTDYPHTGADWPNSRRTVGEERRLTPLSDAEAELIFSDNCRRLYHLTRP